MYIQRYIERHLVDSVTKNNEIHIIYGARQVGKTTLVNSVLNKINLRSIRINADEQIYNNVFSKRDLTSMKELVEGYDILFIDEAQNIEDIGINIKILHDSIPELKIILTGSSSFDLANKVQEPLTGRTKTNILFPIAVCELEKSYNKFELKQLLNDLLTTGSYPKLFNIQSRKEKISHLLELSSSYLYRDILKLVNIKHSKKIYDLLKLLSYQIGNLVSINELAQNLKISNETVEKYIDLLEKSFVIFRLSGFSRNLRKEIKKQDKIYFYDLGIRNAVINNFSDYEFRMDKGQLWENFLIVERMKLNSYKQEYKNLYFWRTYTGAEIDFIEEYDGKLYGYEFKKGTKIPKVPKTWLDTYKNASFDYVNQNNFLNFIT
ncbi:MAG TPA: ATP-binding protein [Bacteroidetes bacterium]|nr:ATP-binding protein [Bacteroidota bacterium]